LQYLFNTDFSGLFYKITREQFIRETIDYYALGNSTTQSQLNDRRNSLCQKYQIENTNLDTLDDILQSGICFKCGQRYNEDSLDSHIKSAHPPSYELSPEAHSAILTFKQRMESEKLAHHNSISQQHVESFSCLDATSTSKFKDYKCHLCKYTFNTSLAAMIAHSESHKSDSFIKISQVKKMNTARYKPPIYRPEEHFFNATTGRFQRQGDMDIFDIIIPDSYNRINNSLVCRKCNSFSVCFYDVDGQKLPITIRSKNATLLSRHEKVCRSC
jgi:hypothetical protein